MPELIQRGHIFIAQPPLYKISRGKQHHYLKDDAALNDYLTQSALDNAALYVSADAPPIAGEALESLVNEYRAVGKTVERLSRLYSADVLWAMPNLPRLSVPALDAEETVAAWVKDLQSQLNDAVQDGKVYTCVVRRDSERNIYFPVVKLLSHGIETETEYNHDFFGSGEYRSLCDLGEKIIGLIEADGYVQRGDKSCETQSFYRVLDWLMAEAAKGYNIQRYKGLGEMNPDQLWETTMDPESRRMLRVTIEDAIAADQIFTTLMGDQVEPRRDFIEECCAQLMKQAQSVVADGFVVRHHHNLVEKGIDRPL